MCPHCGLAAAPVYFGTRPRCARCGKELSASARSAIVAPAKKARVGGKVTRGLGWTILGVGLFFALSLGLFFKWLWPAGILGYLVGGGITLVTVLLSFALLRGGGNLVRAGTKAERQVKEKAVFALAGRQHGLLTVADVSTALRIPTAEADELLTSIAVEQPDVMSCDFDEEGRVFFRVAKRDSIVVRGATASRRAPATAAAATATTTTAKTAAPTASTEQQKEEQHLPERRADDGEEDDEQEAADREQRRHA